MNNLKLDETTRKNASILIQYILDIFQESERIKSKLFMMVEKEGSEGPVPVMYISGGVFDITGGDRRARMALTTGRDLNIIERLDVELISKVLSQHKAKRLHAPNRDCFYYINLEQLEYYRMLVFDPKHLVKNLERLRVNFNKEIDRIQLSFVDVEKAIGIESKPEKEKKSYSVEEALKKLHTGEIL